jgi:hypothetical protein
MTLFGLNIKNLPFRSIPERIPTISTGTVPEAISHFQKSVAIHRFRPPEQAPTNAVLLWNNGVDFQTFRTSHCDGIP